MADQAQTDPNVRTGPSGKQYRWDGSNWTPMNTGVPPSSADPRGFSGVGPNASFAKRVYENMGSALDIRPLMGAAEKLNTFSLIRQMLQHGGKTDEAADALKGLGSGLFHMTTPGIAKDLMQKKDMAPTVANAIGMVGGAMEGPEAAKTFREDLSRVKTAPIQDLTARMEAFRKKFSEPPKGKVQNFSRRGIAKDFHEALDTRLDKEFNHISSIMDFNPTDAAAIKKGLTKLSEFDPYVKKWLQDNIKESKSGASTTAPIWKNVRALNKRLGAILGNKSVNPAFKPELPGVVIDDAINTLNSVENAAAERAGIGSRHAQLKNAYREAQNLKHFTGYSVKPIKPSSLYGLGGMGAGIAIEHGLGGGMYSDILGGFAGRAIGSEIGKRMTPEGVVKVPKESIIGQEQIMRKYFGERGPKLKQRFKPGDVTRPNEPPTEGGSALKGGGPVKPSGGGGEGAVEQAVRRGGGDPVEVKRQARESQLKNAQEKVRSAQTTGERMRAIHNLTKLNEQILKEAGEIGETTDERLGKTVGKSATDFSTRNKARAEEFRANNIGTNVTVTPQSFEKTGMVHSSSTAEGAALETAIFQQVKAAHPDWDIGKVAMEAARVLNQQIGRK